MDLMKIAKAIAAFFVGAVGTGLALYFNIDTSSATDMAVNAFGLDHALEAAGAGLVTATATYWVPNKQS